MNFTLGTVVLVGKIKLKNKWTNDLLESTSEDYKTMSTNYIKLVSTSSCDRFIEVVLCYKAFV
jgi:hypothetical protein